MKSQSGLKRARAAGNHRGHFPPGAQKTSKRLIGLIRPMARQKGAVAMRGLSVFEAARITAVDFSYLFQVSTLFTPLKKGHKMKSEAEGGFFL